MSQLLGTTFGAGMPSLYQTPQTPWGFGQYAQQQPLQQIAQLLQIVPHQLQQIHFQLQQLQQLVQLVPYQFQQLQQPWQPIGAGLGGPQGFGLQSPFIGPGASHVM